MKKRLLFIALTAAWSAPVLTDAAWAQKIDGASRESTNSGALRSAARDDPWEPLNRKFYGLSNVIDKVLFRPIAMTYRRVLPRPVRNAAHNVVANLGEPNVVVNDILQGKIKDAATSSLRFVANTTVGVAGIFDVAREAGLARHDNDFGVTLGKWNLEAGPYIYVPVAGPSSVRDLTGAGVDFFLDPLNWVNFRDDQIFFTTKTVIGAVDARVRVEPNLHDLKAMAVDPYATLRSVYLQSRESRIRDGAVNVDELPDFPDEAPEAGVGVGVEEAAPQSPAYGSTAPSAISPVTPSIAPIVAAPAPN